MTSISSTTSASTLSLLTALSSSSSKTSSSTKIPGYVQTAAKALGMSSSDVMTALQGGQSLADLATQQGVSKDTLTAALKAGAPSGMASSSDMDSKIDALVDTKGVAAPPGGHGHHSTSSALDGLDSSSSSGSSTSTSTTGVLSGTLTKAQSDTLSALASLLGTDSSSLLSSLTGGTSLTDLMSQSGVTTDSLANSSLEDGLMVDSTV